MSTSRTETKNPQISPGSLKTTHWMIVPGNCDGYEPCDFGVYLGNSAAGDTTADYRMGVGGRQTRAHASHVPANILYIPSEPPAHELLDDSKLYREAKAGKEDLRDPLSQVEVTFNLLQQQFAIPVRVSSTTSGGAATYRVDRNPQQPNRQETQTS